MTKREARRDPERVPNRASQGSDLHDALVAEYGMEHETWATERVARVMAKLNKARRGKPKLLGHVLGLREYAAFTLPGAHLYVSRRLLERCANDAEAAMIFAHEAAHHDLGHLDVFAGWAQKVPKVALGQLVGTVFRMFERRVHSQAHEYAADLHALTLCEKAKFDPKECVQVFDILRMHAIDVGDLDAAYGVDDEVDLADGPLDGLFLRARKLVGTLQRSHPSIADRKERLLASLPAREKVPHAPKKPRRRPAAAAAGRVHRRAPRSRDDG